MKLFRQRPVIPLPGQLTLQLDFYSATPAAVVEESSAQPSEPPAPGNALPPSVSTPRPDTGAPADGRRRIQLGEVMLDYRLCRSKRRSIGFLIDDEGLRITAPRWVTLTDIDQAIREKQRWIVAKLTERRERSARRLQPAMQWRDGATLPYLGNDIVLRLPADRAAGIAFNETAGELTVSLPPNATEQQLKDRVQGWLQTEAKRVFSERLPIYAEKLGMQYRSFSLSSAATQWGSCTADGRIRLNWRLIHFTLPQIDYVIAHELAHLREMNHSPRFWATVQSIFPGFEAVKKSLRDHAPESLPVF